MSKTNYFLKANGKKVISSEKIIKRHGGWQTVFIIVRDLSFFLGILGLCAIVLSSPYDIPNYVPEALMSLCEHSHDPDLIQVCWSFIFSNRLKISFS